MSCECGNAAGYESCCGPIIRGENQAETAEALMRSRYSAYVREEIDYLLTSHDPATADQVDSEGAAKWAKEADWERLEIVETEAGGAADSAGIVEFVAHYAIDGTSVPHHERAHFKRVEGVWRYHDGDMVKAKPVKREAPKVGRNEPCPCASGKKFKKCCGR